MELEQTMTCRDADIQTAARLSQVDSDKLEDNADRLDQTNEQMTSGSKMLYKVDEIPPSGIMVSVALQNILYGLGGNLSVTHFISDAICAGPADPVRAQLFCTSLFMTGICTIFQCLVGVRLPIFQVVSSTFLIPLLTMKSAGNWACADTMVLNKTSVESNTTYTTDQSADMYNKLREMMGCLLLSSLFEVVIGATGLVGLLLRFIGPLTIATVVSLIGISLYKIPLEYVRTHWGLSALCIIAAVIFMVYLDSVTLPVPVGIRKRKERSRILKLPVFQMFPVILSILLTWFVCGILTSTNVLSDDPSSLQYRARTDIRGGIIQNTQWFYIPYPGKFGTPLFNVTIFIGFLSAVISSILESIGDYYAYAHVCNVPTPPPHAVNRGIFLEGIGSVLSGAMGAGHATTSSSGHMVLINISKVASRSCLTVTGILCVLLSVIGKFGAVLSTVPDPAIGGAMFVGFAMLTAIGMFMLRTADLSSSRNIAVFGLSVYCGIVIPEWIERYPEAVNTGSEMLNGTIKGLVGTPMFLGGFVALILDNTIEGTEKERGLVCRELDVQRSKSTLHQFDNTEEETYNLPWIEKLLNRWPILKCLPMIQKREDVNRNGDVNIVE